jgi:hypothetical protein
LEGIVVLSNLKLLNNLKINNSIPLKNISIELQLLLAILQNNASTHIDISDYIKPQTNWDYFIQLAKRHRVLPQTYNIIKNINIVPSKIIQILSEQISNIKIQNLTTLGELVRFTKILDSNNIKYAVVKGIPLAKHVYLDYAQRQAKDIDILISEEDLDKATGILNDIGYTITLPKYSLDGFKRQYHLSNKHDIAFFNNDRLVEIELHFNLNYLGLPFFKLDQMPVQCININKFGVNSISDEYHLLYLMTHAAIHAYSRLRWLHDIALYLKNAPVNINKVFEIAQTLKCEHVVIQSLSLVQIVYHINDNVHINTLIENYSSKKSIKITNTAISFITADYELSDANSAINKMFIKYRFYLGDLAIDGQKTKAILGDLFKIDKIFPYITMPKYCNIGYYILYPLMVIKYLILKKF